MSCGSCCPEHRPPHSSLQLIVGWPGAPQYELQLMLLRAQATPVALTTPPRVDPGHPARQKAGVGVASAHSARDNGTSRAQHIAKAEPSAHWGPGQLRAGGASGAAGGRVGGSKARRGTCPAPLPRAGIAHPLRRSNGGARGGLRARGGPCAPRVRQRKRAGPRRQHAARRPATRAAHKERPCRPNSLTTRCMGSPSKPW